MVLPRLVIAGRCKVVGCGMGMVGIDNWKIGCILVTTGLVGIQVVFGTNLAVATLVGSILGCLEFGLVCWYGGVCKRIGLGLLVVVLWVVQLVLLRGSKCLVGWWVHLVGNLLLRALLWTFPYCLALAKLLLLTE